MSNHPCPDLFSTDTGIATARKCVPTVQICLCLQKQLISLEVNNDNTLYIHSKTKTCGLAMSKGPVGDIAGYCNGIFRIQNKHMYLILPFNKQLMFMQLQTTIF